MSAQQTEQKKILNVLEISKYTEGNCRATSYTTYRKKAWASLVGAGVG